MMSRPGAYFRIGAYAGRASIRDVATVTLNPQEQEATVAEKLLRVGDVMAATGLGRTTIWRLERRGDFPRRRVVVGQRVAWLESELTDWLKTRPVAPSATADVGTD